MSRRQQSGIRKTPLDTPLALHLRATYDLPLPARFYDTKTLKPLVNLSGIPEADIAAALINLYEKDEGSLSSDDIAAAYILNPATSPKKGLTPTLIATLKSFGDELLTRFGIENKYHNYSAAQFEADKARLQSVFRATKDYENVLSKGIEAANNKVLEFPTSALSKPEIQQSNLVFTKVSWNAPNVDMSKIRDRDTLIQPIVDKARLTSEDAHDVFNLIHVSSETGGISYLGYHTPSSNQYRVATASTAHPDKDEYSHNVIIESNLYGDLRRSSSFLSFMFRGTFCFLDLSHSTLIINHVPKNGEEAMTQEVIELFPFLRIEGMSRRRITARVVSPIGGSIAYHVLFFDVMYNQADYVGFKEEGEPQLLRPVKSLYLSSIPRVVDPLTEQFAAPLEDIKVVLFNRIAANSELITLDGTGGTHELARGTEYVEMTISEVSDTDTLKFAMAYLSRLVGHYHEVAAEKYEPFIVDDFNLVSSSTISSDAVYSRAQGGDIKGINVITHMYPEVFGHNFTRQCPYYPVVKDHLDDGDVEYVPGTSGEVEGASQWLRYPPDGGIEFYFRCGGTEQPTHQFPGIAVSKLRNKAKYPLIPCCFRTSQFRPGQRTEVAYRLGGATASSITSGDINVGGWGSLVYPPVFNRRLLMKSEKSLFRGRLGRIPEALMTIFASHILPACTGSEGEEGQMIVRLGLSESTMVHAVFLAVDPAYQALSTGTAEQRLSYLRKYLGENLPYPACLYQELPASECTREALMSGDSFTTWNTTTHYRILEEVLNINLYVVLRIAPRENVQETNHYNFEFPRTRGLGGGTPHMRRHAKDRPSVILYRVRRIEDGGESLVDSGVELLMHGDETTPFSGVWGTGCSVRIGELYSRANQVLSFGTSPVEFSTYVACVGLNTADYASSIPDHTPVSQLIDERGLCRALTFEEGFSAVFPGTQPYNLPFSIELKKISYDPDCRRIFGDACSISSAKDGVFYILGDDPTRYIFVPINSGDEVLLPVSSYTPLTSLSATSIGFNVHWRRANTYLRVLLFFFAFLYAFADSPRDPQEFMEKHVIIDTERHSSHASDVYDFSGLKRVIQLKETTMKEALATIKRLAPSLLDPTGKKLVVTSTKIYEAMGYYIRTVHTQTEASTPQQLRKRRWDLAEVVSPIRKTGGPGISLLTENRESASTLNFGSTREVRRWFAGLHSGETSSGTTSDARDVMELVKSRTGVIMFYHPHTRRVWLIPAITTSLRDAIVVGYLWQTQHRVMQLNEEEEGAVTRLAVQSGARETRGSRITAMFRRSNRGASAATGRLLRHDDDNDEEELDLSELRHLVDSPEGNVTLNKYVVTRDNNIELLVEDSSSSSQGGMVIEVLRTAYKRFTPMLSP